MTNLPETFVQGFHDEETIRKMPYASMGQTGMSVSKLSLGAAGFSYFYGDYNIEECKQTIHAAIKSGVNFIDTAPWYGHGVSETILGQCLEGIPRKAYYIATKVCRYEKDVKKMFDFSSEGTRRSIDESLKRLKLDYVDLLQVHDIEFAPSLNQVLQETLPCLQEIVKSGKAKHIGITGYPVSVLKECIEKSSIPIETVLSYGRSTMIDGTLDEYVPFLRDRHIGIIKAAVTAMGLLTNSGPQSWHPGDEEMKKVCKEAAEFCKENNVELGKLAVHNGFQNENADTVLIGMNNIKYLDYNLDVLFNGINEQEAKVYAKVKEIVNQLPSNANWENVELEQYKKDII